MLQEFCNFTACLATSWVFWGGIHLAVIGAFTNLGPQLQVWASFGLRGRYYYYNHGKQIAYPTVRLGIWLASILTISLLLYLAHQGVIR